MQTWEYHIESFTITERWSGKKQGEELEKMRTRLNALGNGGWEMVGYETTPLIGGITGSVKGQLQMAFFKRPKETSKP